jgi:hypothetical protein
MIFAMFVVMTSAHASRRAPNPGSSAKTATNRTATAALVVAIVGFVVTQIPFFVGLFAGSPEDIAAVILGIAGIVTAFRRGTGKVKAIVATILAVASLVGIGFGDGWLW